MQRVVASSPLSPRRRCLLCWGLYSRRCLGLSLLALFFVLGVGCYDCRSPLLKDEDIARVDGALVGVWDSTSLAGVEVKAVDNRTYEIVWSDGIGRRFVAWAHMGSIGALRVADVELVVPGRPATRPVRTFAILSQRGSDMRVSSYNPAWLVRYVQEHPDELPAEQSADKVLTIRATTDQLQAFMRRHADIDPGRPEQWLSADFVRRGAPTATRPTTRTEDGMIYRPPLTYTTRPLALQQVRDVRLPVRLPNSATDVQFASYGYWLSSQLWLSFRAEPAECQEHAAKLLEAWNRENPLSRVSTELKPINRELQQEYLRYRLDPANPRHASAATYRQDTKQMPIGWFAPETIEVGFEGGGSRAKVWIDAKKGFIYYQQGDGIGEGNTMELPGLPPSRMR